MIFYDFFDDFLMIFLFFIINLKLFFSFVLIFKFVFLIKGFVMISDICFCFLFFPYCHDCGFFSV